VSSQGRRDHHQVFTRLREPGTPRLCGPLRQVATVFFVECAVLFQLLHFPTLRDGWRRSPTGDDLNQRHVENQIAIGRDFITDGAIAVGEIGGDVERPLISRFHEFKGLAPAGDEL
jgi:hypothetical protein